MRHSSSDEQRPKAHPTSEQRNRWQQTYRRRKKAQMEALEERFSELQGQLSEAELDIVQTKAELTTLTNYLADSGTLAARSRRQQRGSPWQRPVNAELEADTFHIDEEGAAELAHLVAAVRGSAAPAATVAECRSPTAAFMADLYEEIRERLVFLLQQPDVEVECSAAAADLEPAMKCFKQIWAMADDAVLWRVSPPLFYATVNEIWKRTIARHGAAPTNDADVRLAAMALTADQKAELLAVAEAMVARLAAIYTTHGALLQDLRELPLAASGIHPNSAAAPSMALLQRLRDILGDHCGFWVEFHPLQAARGLVTTPYPLCAMLLGIRLVSRKYASEMGGEEADLVNVMAWVREPEPPSAAAPSGGGGRYEGLYTALQNLAERQPSLEQADRR